MRLEKQGEAYKEKSKSVAPPDGAVATTGPVNRFLYYIFWACF